MDKRRTIRLGMLRCDIHAYFFAPMMVRTHALKLQEHCAFIHHILSDQFKSDKLVVRPTPGFKLTHVWDPDPAEAARFAQAFVDRPVVCRRPADMVGQVDAAFVSNCSYDASDHLAIVRPILKAGTPAFIDKPVANNYRNARAIVDLARRHKAPLFAASMLQHADEVHQFRRRLRDFGRVGVGMVEGSHGWETSGGLEGITHGVALALTAFGDGPSPDWVECMGALPREMILIHYPDDRHVLIWNMEENLQRDGFYVRAWGEHATVLPKEQSGRMIESARIGSPEFKPTAQKLVRMFRDMVRTGKPPESYDRILEWCRVCDAAERAQRTGTRVRV